MKWSDKAKRFSDLANNLDKVTVDWLYDNKEQLLDQQAFQWDEGLAKNGKFPIYASKSYEEFKRNVKGSKSGSNYDIKLTGETREKRTVKKVSKGVVIDSTSEATPNLKKLTSGYGLFGLNKKYIAEFISYTKQDFIKKLKDKLK